MEKELDRLSTTDRRAGMAYGIIAFTAWGFLPLYWKLLKAVPPEEILAHRVFWSFIYVGIMLIYTGNFSKVKEVLRDRRNIVLVLLASILITINWFTYIWAVNSNYVLQTSIGYYINPLVVSLLSIVVLKERFSLGEVVALLLATIGVLIQTFSYGKFPWVALIIAVSFALYGLVKKLLTIDSMTGLALETTVIAPFALIFILTREFQGTGGTLQSLPIATLLLLTLSGVATATPLLWFAKGAQKIEFSTIGFLQYISPTITMFLGIFVFKEVFSKTHFISFGFIWAALVVFTFAKLRVTPGVVRRVSISKGVK